MMNIQIHSFTINEKTNTDSKKFVFKGSFFSESTDAFAISSDI